MKAQLKNRMKSQEFLRRALNLCLAVYRITDQFPQGEVLREQLRETGGTIAGELAAGNFSQAGKNIEKIQIFFQIARRQKWVRSVNWSVLDYEYGRLKQEAIFDLEEGKEEIQNEPEIVSHNVKEAKKPSPKRAVGFADALRLTGRQEKILEQLKSRPSLKMSDLVPLFKNQASERTLRNELQDLVKRGVVVKTGFKKSAMYKMK